MEEKLHAIVLGTVKHSDRNNVLTVYTATRGRMAFLVPASASRASRQRNALLMPLSLIEITARIRPGRDLHTFTSLTPLTIWSDIYFNPLKTSVGIFLAEFLSRLLADTPPDPQMWNFIADSLRFFDNTRRGVANFHIAFLTTLTHFVGIAPDTADYSPTAYFDIIAGCYTSHRPSHQSFLVGEDARMPRLLMRISYANIHLWRFNRDQRRRTLTAILRYYDAHIPGFSSLRSTEVLRQIFD